MRPLLDRLRHLGIAAAALTLFLGAGWWAIQDQLAPRGWGRATAGAAVLFDSLLPLVVWWLGAAGWGYPLKRWLGGQTRCPKLLQLGCGIGTMLLLDWFCGLAGLVGSWSAWGLCTAGLALLIWQLGRSGSRDFFRVERWPNPPWPLLLGLPVLALYLVACTCPPGTLWTTLQRGHEAFEWHLELPRQWLALPHPRIVGLHENVYSYFPNLVEAGYVQILAMRGPTPQAFYTAQFLTAGLTCYAAAVVGCLVGRLAYPGGRVAGMAAFVCFLALPWTITVGTVAFPDSAALAFGGLAILIAFESMGRTWRGAVLVGFFCGLAILAWPRAAVMLALPTFLILGLGLARAKQNSEPPQASAAPPAGEAGAGASAGLAAWRLLLIAAAALTLTLAPYLARNALWTGNPVFPLATPWFGKAHWSEDSVQRWNASLAPPPKWGDRGLLLTHRWLFSAGYGTVGGRVREPGSPSQEAIFGEGRFEVEGGIPLFWMIVAGALVLGVLWPATRVLATAMGLMLAVQLLAGFFTTPLEGRELLPTILPGTILAGLGAGRLEQLARHSRPFFFPVLLIVLALGLVRSTFLHYLHQGRQWDIRSSQWELRPTGLFVANLEELTDADIRGGKFFTRGDHALNHLPRPSQTHLIAGTSSLLYIRSPVTYATAFDEDPVGRLLAAGVNGRTVTTILKRQGYTHVWINWAELARWQALYGYDPGLTVGRLYGCAIEGRWKKVDDYPHLPPVPLATLFELP